MGDAVIAADRDARFVVFNPAAKRMFGVPAAGTLSERRSHEHGLYWPDNGDPLPDG